MTLGLRYATFFTGSTLAIFIVAAALGSQACTVELSNGTFDGGFDFPDAQVVPGATDNCSRCVYSQCSALQAVCNTNRECLSIYNCALQPGASATDCYNAHPTGQSAYLSLANCGQRNACTSCGITCEGSAVKTNCSRWVEATPDAGPATAPDTGTTPEPDAAPPPVVDAGPQPTACDVCITTNCASEKAACGAGSECAVNNDCIQACASGATDKIVECLNACGASHPAGKTAGEALGACTSKYCTAACF
jgi:hypothetical protein